MTAFLPRFAGGGVGEQRQCAIKVAGNGEGDHRDLSAVEHALADAVVALEVGVCVLPVACAGQGSCAVGEMDGPQPPAQLLVIV